MKCVQRIPMLFSPNNTVGTKNTQGILSKTPVETKNTQGILSKTYEDLGMNDFENERGDVMYTSPLTYF